MMNFKTPLHGANPEKLYAAMGLPMPEDVIDFSTNASVFPWTLPPLDFQGLFSRYPDGECLELRRLVAGREGLPVENILFTNGSNEALYLLASYLTEKRAAILQPAYPEYARALASSIFLSICPSTMETICPCVKLYIVKVSYDMPPPWRLLHRRSRNTRLPRQRSAFFSGPRRVPTHGTL